MKLLPLFVFWCLWFLNFSTRTVFSPVLPMIEDNLNLSHGEAGGFFSSLSIGHGLTLLIAGRFASVWGHKRMVAAGFICTGLVFVGLQWVESYIAFHVLFFLLGVATGTYLPSILPIITEIYEHKYWGKVIGFHDSAASVSIFSIPILVAFGLQFLPWRRLFLILGIASLLLLIYFWKVSIEPKTEVPQQGSSYINLFKRRAVWTMAILWIFAAGSCLGLYSILPLYLIKERGIDLYFANNLFGISRVGGAFVSILIGFLTDRYGYQTILKWSILMTGLATIGLSLSSTLLQISITLILQATLSLAFFPVGFAAISKLTPLWERSMATGAIVSIGVIFGLGGTPFLLGLVADHFSFQIGILLVGVLTTLSSVGVKFLRERQEQG